MIAAFAGLAVLVAVVALAVRSANRRRRALDARLSAAVERRCNEPLSWTDRRVRATTTGATLTRVRLRRAARKTDNIERAAKVAAELLTRPLVPMQGPLSLKVHGPRVGLHLVDPLVLDLLAPDARPAHRPEAELGLAATYRVDGRADRCVTEDHLSEQAIDTRDLHGIALAVLRQRFDEDLARRLDAGESALIESDDGTAVATLLLLPDFLAPETRIEARLEGPDRLVLGASAEPSGTAGHPALDLLISAQGWRVL